MTNELRGTKAAILATHGFEQSELTVPRDRLREAGVAALVVSPEKDRIRGWRHGEWGDQVDVDISLDDAAPGDFDALILPGGQMNPDFLRASDAAVRFVREFALSGKPTAAICHGPWLLIEADLVRGRTATSYHSIKTDMRNAGANWVDQETVVDGNLLTSRAPGDLEAFSARLIELMASKATRTRAA